MTERTPDDRMPRPGRPVRCVDCGGTAACGDSCPHWAYSVRLARVNAEREDPRRQHGPGRDERCKPPPGARRKEPL